MDTLRIVLIILGIAVIVGIYLWEKFHKDDLPDRYSPTGTDDANSPGLVITTQTKFNEEDLSSELADLNFFMGDSLADNLSENEITNEIKIHTKSDDSLIARDSGHDMPVVEEGADIDDEAPANNETEQGDKKSVAEHIIVLHVVVDENNLINGRVLMEIANNAGFEFGDMNVFHYRDVGLSGEMKTLFSLVNMFEPGYFEPDKMDEFSTRGISVFATLKNDGTDAHVFDTMLDTTRQIAEQLGADIWGPDKSLLSEETLGYIQLKLRESE